MSEILSVREAAALLKLCKGSLDRYRRLGIGPRYSQRGPCCAVTYTRSDLMAWRNSHMRISVKDHDSAQNAPQPQA